MAAKIERAPGASGYVFNTGTVAACDAKKQLGFLQAEAHKEDALVH